MFDYVTNTTYAELAGRIRAAQRLALVSHQKPDGDAIGSVFALSRALPGKTVDNIFRGPVERFARVIAEGTPYRTDEETPADDYDLIVVLDTGAWSQVGSLAPWLRKRFQSPPEPWRRSSPRNRTNLCRSG